MPVSGLLIELVISPFAGRAKDPGPAKQYLQRDQKCHDLATVQDWKEAEKVCGAVVHIADQLSDDPASQLRSENVQDFHVTRVS